VSSQNFHSILEQLVCFEKKKYRPKKNSAFMWKATGSHLDPDKGYSGRFLVVFFSLSGLIA
jgi:hypothetical protein